ncbi:hypothetical protein KC19_7G173800 [Ceratodon purpureus]|uniref:Uncharacterized protein n=1 Tax=Ceratodon purpureus TaxID=3225 RepID=A0A8T0HAP1_CERPU|nr:hypothetical protein KC19_7G173800 [Ceratodon purpureus]
MRHWRRYLLCIMKTSFVQHCFGFQLGSRTCTPLEIVLAPPVGILHLLPRAPFPKPAP